MATTTNYSWSTPDDTALVKDGAAAIRSLGTAIDTTVFNNAGAAIAKTLIDAKGDLIVGSAADTVARLAAGTNGYVLSANSGATNGLEWIAPAGSAGITLIQNQTIGSAVSSITLTSVFSSTYDNYLVQINGGTATGDTTLDLTLGSVATGYYRFGWYGNPTSATILGDNGNDATSFRYVAQCTTSNMSGFFTLHSPNLAKPTIIYAHAARNGAGQTTQMQGNENSNTQHTAFTLTVNSGTMTGGFVRVYGYSNS